VSARAAPSGDIANMLATNTINNGKPHSVYSFTGKGVTDFAPKMSACCRIATSKIIMALRGAIRRSHDDNLDE
jgi:hypothetical protein